MVEDWKNTWCDESGCGSSGPYSISSENNTVKDVKALIEHAREHGIDNTLVGLVDTLTYNELLRLKSIVDFYYNTYKGQ